MADLGPELSADTARGERGIMRAGLVAPETSDYQPEGWEKVAGDLYEALRSFGIDDVERWWSFVALPAMERYWTARLEDDAS